MKLYVLTDGEKITGTGIDLKSSVYEMHDVTIAEFNLLDPDTVEAEKYIYRDGHVVENPLYSPPAVPSEAERIAALEAAVLELAEVLADG